jgi:hypothetical protein
MPRMNGYQFCRVLRSRNDMRQVPIILMSAKGDKIRGQFVQQTGAIDAITKPFDARGLIAVVEGALERTEEGRAPPVPDVETMVDEDLEGMRTSRTTGDQLALQRAHAAHEFGSALARVLVPHLARAFDTSAAKTTELEQAVIQATSPEVMDELAPLLMALDFGEGTQEVLSGDISVISIAEILQLLHLQRQTGALSIFTRKAEITLYVHDGNVDFATQRGLREEYVIGRFLVTAGAVDRETLELVVQEQDQDQTLLGEMLITRGLASGDEVCRALTQQTSELVYEVVRWKKGRFKFINHAENPAAEKAQLGLPTSALVMEGFRRVDEWQLIEGSFDFNDVLVADPVALENVHDSALPEREQAVLSGIDGERTIGELIDEMGGSSFELCKILYQFLNSRLVRRKASSRRPPPPQAQGELN